MAHSPNMFGWNGDDDDIFKYFEFPLNEYIAPSTLDDRSTTAVSELDVPPLTSGPSLSQLTRSKASQSQGPPEDPGFHYEFDLSWPNRGHDDMGDSPLDKSTLFRHIGENPECLDQEALSSRPKRLCLDDSGIGQSPQSPLSQVVSPSQSTATPMKRGRTRPLPTGKRVKVSTMRNIKACHWCRIHKVECNEATPCDRCRTKFPTQPEACDRARLYEIRFPDRPTPTNIWLDNPYGAILHREYWRSTGYQTTAAVTLNQTFGVSPNLDLTPQMCVATSGQFPPLMDYYAPPTIAGLGGVPISTFGYPTGSFAGPNVSGSLVVQDPRPSQDDVLLFSAESRLSAELEEHKSRSFTAAVGALLLAYKNSLSVAPESRPANGKKKRQIGVVDTKDLVCRVVELQCWFRIWRNPALYCQVQRRQPLGMSYAAVLQSSITAIPELRDIANTALMACERAIFSKLDELSPRLARDDELPVWACFWQMLLTYRDLITMYSRFDQSQSTNLSFGMVREDISGALDIVKHLYRLLVIKLAAYISSSSPIFHKRDQPETGAMLAGDERLQREWENVLLQREDFYCTISEEVPLNAFLKDLIIDEEHNMERRRKKRRNQ
ncbi:hypothetical protein VP1G_10122 [Cytospora mali]|uniref:Zn(2)-C6 fungal-type domain-containing protein n=1 Tax=Cytospora mali TaxID=578113 RepID=A0A194VG55_CYTMA|nr:hypothetical protein VP1G_10122 [Valsa mali var. pyri (nom. inval.)]